MDTVFALAFAQLSERALDLLRFMSLLDGDNIDLELLHIATAELRGVPREHNSTIYLLKLFKELQRRSLIKRKSLNKKTAYSMHRVVQLMVRTRYVGEQTKGDFCVVAKCIKQGLESEGQVPDPKHEHSLLTHLVVLEDHVGRYLQSYEPISIPELQDLQLFVRERSWLVDQYSKLRGESLLNFPGEHKHFDSEWASTTTLVNPAVQSEAAELIFSRLLETDRSFVVAASGLLKHVGAEAFRRKCTDLLTLLPVHLQDEQPASAEMLQELKMFGNNVNKFTGYFESALERAKTRHTNASLGSKDEDTNRTRINSMHTEHSHTFTTDHPSAIATSYKQELNLPDSSGCEGSKDVQEMRDMLMSKDTTAMYSDFILFVLESHATTRFKNEIESQAKACLMETQEAEAASKQQHKSIGDEAPLVRRQQPVRITVTRTCKCGTTITGDYMEYVEGAVEAHIKQRDQRQSHQTSAPGTRSQNRGWAKSISNALSIAWNGMGFRSSRKHLPTQGPDPLADGSLESPPTQTPTGRNKYLQLCISRYRRYEQTSYSSHDLRVDSDRILYDALRSEYSKLIGRWGRLLTLRRVDRIRFAKFRSRKTKFIQVETRSESETDSRVRESLPEAGDDDYRYAPPEPGFLPPIPHEEMLHYFYDACNGQDDDCHVRSLPGHKLDEIPFGPAEDQKYVWGIQILEAEKREWLYASLPGFVVIITSAVFGIVWSAVKDDVHTGFTVATFLLAAGLSLLGSVVVYLENA